MTGETNASTVTKKVQGRINLTIDLMIESDDDL